MAKVLSMVGEWPRSSVWCVNGQGPQYGGRMAKVLRMAGEWPRSSVWWENGQGPQYGV